MADFETELKVARGLFEKRLKTLKRLKHHVHNLSQSSDEFSTGEIALKIAEAELDSARTQLESTIHSIRQRSQTKVTSSASETDKSIQARDHFSEALDRVDPKSRLQLGR